MSTHRGQRIYQLRSFLNPKPLDRIRIIGGPDLRAVIQHPCIKSGSAGGAVLQKKIREISQESLLHLIQSQNITVIQLPCMLRIQRNASNVRKIPVHIPFHIVNVRTL